MMKTQTTPMTLPGLIRRSGIAAAVLLSFLATGCGPAKPPVKAAGSGPVTAITITGDDRMRFAPTTFTVARGTEITVTFDNIGSVPKEAMGHNLVILKPGTNANGFAASGMAHAARSYIAPELEDRVVAFTPVLGPKEKYKLVFTAPDEPGDYPFVCSFPGHTPAGMVGTMKVQ
ncbi:MAG TPA: plastocyanin/azurin family copper-binding protein [Opitutaceae bacterium]|nr:plastocyanin/azurin family copper-binding protein [Opitutaceae bacterium]HRJ47446.1 plastocyanin/azurin family copper-binding protein [Opitutaceae bacterium]